MNKSKKYETDLIFTFENNSPTDRMVADSNLLGLGPTVKDDEILGGALFEVWLPLGTEMRDEPQAAAYEHP